MQKKKLIYLDCAEALKVCDKSEYMEASLANRFRLRLHLLFCESCKKYHQQNRKLSLLMNKASLKTCTAEEKEMFKTKLNQRGSQDTSENE